MTTTLSPEAYQTAAAYQALYHRFQGVLLGFLAYRAGKNHYDITHDLGDAVLKGAEALRRWWIWLFFTKLWLLWLGVTGWITYMENHKIRGEGFVDYDGSITGWSALSWKLLPFAFVLGIVVPYCRNVDFSLFKRRWFYKLLRPVTYTLNSIPVGLLYLTIVVGLFHW